MRLLVLGLFTTLGRREGALTKADGLGRYLNQLVVLDVLKRLFERERDGRRKGNGLVGAGRALIAQLLGLGNVDDHVALLGGCPRSNPRQGR